MIGIVEGSRRIYLLPVRLYKLLLSPVLPPSCRYLPTCSDYFIEAVLKRGIVVGTVKGIGRLLRCHPLGGSGHDPPG